MSSIIHRVATRYANRKKAQENNRGWAEGVTNSNPFQQPAQALQAKNNLATSRGRRPFVSCDSRELVERVLLAYNQKNKPQEEDLEVDGVPESTDWNEPATDWMQEKQAAIAHLLSRKGSSVVDMVACVRGKELLGARDARKTGAQDLRFWDSLVDKPFDLYKLQGVPMALAKQLNDLSVRRSRMDPKQAWKAAQEFADFRPFKKGR